MFPGGTLPAARAVARVGGERLLLFSIVDDHAHFVVLGTRAQASALAGGLTRSLAVAGAPARNAAFVQEVDGRSHLESLVRYTSRQVEKHGLGVASATWPGSSAPDLLRIRRLAGFEPERIAASLPRFDVGRAVAAACGVGALRAATDAELGGFPAHDVFEVALAAGGVTVKDRDWHAVAVRVAWASLGVPVDRVPQRTWRALRAREADPRLVEVIRRRLAFVRQSSAASRAMVESSAEFDHGSGRSRADRGAMGGSRAGLGR